MIKIGDLVFDINEAENYINVRSEVNEDFCEQLCEGGSFSGTTIKSSEETFEKDIHGWLYDVVLGI